MSTIDIALWDIKGRALNQPLYKLLGAYTDKVPVYSSGGYYRQGESFQQMADEMAGIVERGFRGIKIKVGALSFKEEVERMRTLRRTVGDEVEIMVDANCAWNDLTYARKIMRAFEEYNIGWFEEPVLPDNFRGSAELAATVRDADRHGGAGVHPLGVPRPDRAPGGGHPAAGRGRGGRRHRMDEGGGAGLGLRPARILPLLSRRPRPPDGVDPERPRRRVLPPGSGHHGLRRRGEGTA